MASHTADQALREVQQGISALHVETRERSGIAVRRDPEPARPPRADAASLENGDVLCECTSIRDIFPMATKSTEQCVAAAFVGVPVFLDECDPPRSDPATVGTVVASECRDSTWLVRAHLDLAALPAHVIAHMDQCWLAPTYTVQPDRITAGASAHTFARTETWEAVTMA